MNVLPCSTNDPGRPRVPFALAALVAILAAAPCVRAQSATASQSDDREKAVKLDPFEVKEDSDNSYGALNSNSITQFNTALNKLPLSADVFDRTFIDDVGATTIEQMLQTYSAGMGFSGADPAGGGATGAATAQPGDLVGNGRQQMRGFGSARMERDSLMPVGSFYNPGGAAPNSTSAFDVERVEVINGPQAMLYSGGGAGGVINVTSKQARLGEPAFGSLSFTLDQYGSKMGQLDYGMGTDHVALRVALIDQDQMTRRTWLGGQLYGGYAQLAVKVGNTTFRLNAEQTHFLGTNGTTTDITAGSAANDPRNDQFLRYLLASHTAGAINPATGVAYPDGAIDNGLLTWSNVDSETGWLSQITNTNAFENLTVDSRWASWLSTQFTVGYNSVYFNRLLEKEANYDPPAAAALLGINGWAMGDQPEDRPQPGRSKGIRGSALITNDLFGGKVHSQTIVGGDFVRNDAASLQYVYFQADSNWNEIINPATMSVNDGKTMIPTLYWSINNGNVQYPFFKPFSSRITVNGINYVRDINNQINPALISPANPLGTTNTTNYEISKLFNKGVYAVNYTDWMDGKLTTLAGVRLANAFIESINSAGAQVVQGNAVNIDVGANYELLSWLRPYIDVSSAYEPPQAIQFDPVGHLPVIARGLSEEVGVKFNNRQNTLSGSLAVYHTQSKDEQYEISSTLENDVNPTSLNGVSSNDSQWVHADQKSMGAQMALTANPIPNWRMRLSAAVTHGTIEDSLSYNQLYNGQFHEDSSGDVTYADGSIVYVNPTYNSKTLTVTSTTPGAIPLTVTAMSTPGNAYFASPVAITGVIATGSPAANVLRVVDPVHGAILTGALSLPMSQYQLNSSLSGVTPAGVISVAQTGDQTMGYPQYSFNFTNKYTVPGGWLKGFSVGGTVGASWKYNYYYYYPTGVPTVGRQIFSAPTTGRVDLLLGYARKFGRVTWSTQLNIYNLFNHYTILILPNEITGWTDLTRVNATFFGQPRSYQWTNTFRF